MPNLRKQIGAICNMTSKINCSRWSGWLPHCNVVEIESSQIVDSRCTLKSSAFYFICRESAKQIKFIWYHIQICQVSLAWHITMHKWQGKLVRRVKWSAVLAWHTCDEIFVSRPLRPDSREPAICMKVFVSRFNTKTMWLLHRTSTNAK